ncbi:MAG: 3-hydroxyacyl-CoA dehydrogenase (short-chain) [Acidimicrobiales bacterium]|jgi:NAD(P)-dependent dehydrogenase (short-subunit alcohol dehydrogenase family)|nr:3-hydroxyacyl-CoA dehydrogenase (short-chain) [Acidimicrobiales bacterium]
MQIAGASALVTGGASGLGEATVRRLHAGGAMVTIVDRDEAKAKALAAELGGQTSYLMTDVTDPDQAAAAVAQAASAGPLRIAVNCAGIGWVGRVINRDNSPHDFGAFTKVIEINLIGTFNMMRLAASAIAATQPLEDNERGVIVNTASVAAFDGQIGQLAYSASKGGIVGMTLPAARDLSAVGIRVVTIAPGTFDTPLFAGAPDEVRDALGAAVPFPKRMGRPDEYAALVAHIAENVMLNGEVIRLDGAIRMPPK